MIYQRFEQGVSNLSTVAELRTFDGKQPYSFRYEIFLGRDFFYVDGGLLCDLSLSITWGDTSFLYLYKTLQLLHSLSQSPSPFKGKLGMNY
jgi:hypothetical protein